MRDFDFFVGGIEDGILETLEAGLKPLGVKGFHLYSGELETDNLKRAFAALAPQFPLVMVSYTDGADVVDPKTAPILGKPLHFRHECSFVVICASNDARGETARRRGGAIGAKKMGAYGVLANVRRLLGGLTIKTIDPANADEKVLLTHQPLMPNGVEYIAKMPDITAYAAIFDTYFRYSTLDRSAAGIAVSEFVLGVESRNAPSQTKNNPGVNYT